MPLKTILCLCVLIAPIVARAQDIFEKTLPRWRLSFNPVVGRALRGPDAGDGFDFEPGAKVAYFLKGKDRFNVGLEYYGSLGPLTNFHRAGDQVHLLFPSADIYFSDTLMLNLGVGVGATRAGEQLILKSRLGYRF